MPGLTRFLAGLLLASMTLLPLVCGETKLGLASFSITGVRRVGDSLAVVFWPGVARGMEGIGKTLSKMLSGKPLVPG